ncbi:hypothetical protein M9458_006705, partial [Cirrhinus mrigala]
RRDLPFVELAMMSGLNDATINSLFWIGATYNHPVDLLDTTGLSWREGIPMNVRPQSRTVDRSAQHPSTALPLK